MITFKLYSFSNYISKGENHLTKIESNVFQHMNKLKRLFLCNNQITQIETNGLNGLENLEKLLLDGNRLTEIDSILFQRLNKLISLDLSKKSLF
jgi:Leucine-rich repeat (LRR) protein